jgi:hypothetical protein
MRIRALVHDNRLCIRAELTYILSTFAIIIIMRKHFTISLLVALLANIANVDALGNIVTGLSRTCQDHFSGIQSTYNNETVAPLTCFVRFPTSSISNFPNAMTQYVQ